MSTSVIDVSEGQLHFRYDHNRMRPVPGYPGYYATDQGYILSIGRGYMCPKTERLHKGYLHVQRSRSIAGHKRMDKVPVHQLVLLAFVGPKPTPRHQTRHLNGNPLDNRPSNLVWGTASENMQDQVRHGTAVAIRRGDKHPAAKLSERLVRDILSLLADGRTTTSVAFDYGVTQGCISGIKRGITWSHLPRPQQVLRKANTATMAGGSPQNL